MQHSVAPAQPRRKPQPERRHASRPDPAPCYHPAVERRIPVLPLCAIVIAACGSAPPRHPEAPKSVASADKPAAPRPRTPRDRLAAALRGVVPDGPVIGALTPALRAQFDAMVKRLDPAQVAELTRHDGPVAIERPLLHLAAGGDSPSALLALATTSHGADELVAMRRGAGDPKIDDLPAVVASVARHAAKQWLHDTAADVSADGKIPADLCDAIDRAAATLELFDVERLAREVAADIENTPDRQLAVANVAAWQLDPDAAASALSAAKKLDEHDTLGARAARTARWVDLARLAHDAKGKKLDLDHAVDVAWALLELHREDEALAVLAPFGAQAEHNLRLAAARALASAGGGICPGLSGGAANAVVCAVAWNADASVKQNIAILGKAWDSKQARDDRSIETWIGYSYVVPWIYSTVQQAASREEAERAFRGRLQALERGAKDASAASHAFDGLLLFTDTLGAGFEAAGKRKPNERVKLPVPVQTELARRAEELGARSPAQRFTQAGVLGVAAMLAQERDVLPLIKLLPDALPHDLAVPRGELRLWAAVANRRADEAERARSEIAAELPSIDDPMTRSRLVLTLAEANAALTHSERAYAVLAQVSAQLIDPRVPAELKLRAAVDDAGALARAGKEKDAEGILEQVTTTTQVPNDSSTEHDLATIAKGYLLVLRGRAAAGDERKDYRDKLSHLTDGAASAIPASITLWRDLWVAELDRLARAERCGAMKCAGAAPKLDAARIDAAIGPESGRIVRDGTLAAGTVRLWFDFSGTRGLRAVVVLEPRLLAVEFPPTK